MSQTVECNKISKITNNNNNVIKFVLNCLFRSVLWGGGVKKFTFLGGKIQSSSKGGGVRILNGMAR